MIRFLRGFVQLRITGATPERCLNRFAAEGIAFWRMERLDALQLRCRVYQKDLARAKRAAMRALCTAECEGTFGFRARYGSLKKRPLLLLGLLAAVLLALLAQNYVWVVRIEGNETLGSERLRRALIEEGVGFGTPSAEIDSLHLRYRMQLRLPELRWLAANRSGGVLTVLVTERKQTETTEEPQGIANVCAARDGVVTRIMTEKGTAAVMPGQAVTEGELLISGITCWDFTMQLAHAKGEVYALTARAYRTVLPATALEKRYTGETAREVTLIFGRNRRKISGNSRISTDSCDKMIVRKVCTLPGGDELPFAVEIVEYRYYETVPVTVSPKEAQALLEAFARRDASRRMVAGEIRQAEARVTKEKDCYLGDAILSCEELISVTVPVGSPGEDEALGEADQRGAD